MSTVKTKGLVLKQSDFKESNRILTIFTQDYGIITVVAYGAKSIRNKNSSASQVMTYSDFILSDTKKDMMSVQSAEIIESFFGVKEDIVKLSLSVYFADLVYSLLNTNSPDDNMLSLLLNSLYALSYRETDINKLKAVFEIRAMSFGGYMPDIYNCVKCGVCENITHFSPENGGILCNTCSKNGGIAINAEVYKIIHYILTSDNKKMLSFEASNEAVNTVGEISERYVEAFSDKKFKSLEYYKQMLG